MGSGLGVPKAAQISTTTLTDIAALGKLREAAERAGRTEIVTFAEALVEHARTPSPNLLRRMRSKPDTRSRGPV
jgi:hypothetical protein